MLRFLSAARDPQVLEAADLAGDQITQLKQLVEQLHEEGERAKPHLRFTSRALDAVIREPDSASRWETMVKTFPSNLEAGWREATNRLDYQYWLASNAWRAVCLARHEGRDAFVTELTPVIERMKEINPDPLAQKLLGQVLTLPGGKPRHSSHGFPENPSEFRPGRPGD
jgi:hypothetical protein